MALFRRFTIFSELPTELRNMIRKLTLRPRIIEIQFTNKKAVYTKSKLPIALYVSRESRTAVEKLYPLCFGSVWHRYQTRFNFDLDTIFLNSDYYNDFCHFFTLAGSIELHRIRYLAIDNYCQYICNNNQTDKEDFEKLKEVIESMKALQELSVTYNAERFFEKCLWIGEEFGAIQIYDTIPVLKMVKETDLDNGIQVNWQEVGDVVSGPSDEEFKDWQVRSRRAVFSKRKGRYPYYQEFEDEI